MTRMADDRVQLWMSTGKARCLMLATHIAVAVICKASSLSMSPSLSTAAKSVQI